MVIVKPMIGNADESTGLESSKNKTPERWNILPDDPKQVPSNTNCDTVDRGSKPVQTWNIPPCNVELFNQQRRDSQTDVDNITNFVSLEEPSIIDNTFILSNFINRQNLDNSSAFISLGGVSV